MKHINITNWQGNITDWTKFNYIYGGLDETIADRVNLSIPATNLRNYFRKSNNLLQLTNASGTINGITYSVSNGTITLNGTATSGTNIFLELSELILNGDYYYTEFSSVIGVSRALRYNTTNVQNLSKPITFSKENAKVNKYLLYIATGTTITNGVIKPMLVTGNVEPTTYEPYDSMVLVENVAKAFIDSNCTFEAGTYRVYVNLSDMVVAPTRTLPVSMNGYTCIDGNQTYDPTWDKVVYNGSSTHIYVTNKAYVSKTQWIEKEGNNPIIYPLAEPKVTVFGQVDLGMLEWHYRALGEPSYYDAYLPNVVNSINVSCPLYKSALVFSTNTEDKTICTAQNAVRIRDNALQGSVVDLESKLKGVILIYEPASQPSASTLSMASPMQLDKTNVEEDIEYLEDTKFNEEILSEEE